jgi:uncharacterized membrane-anchored protein
MVPSFGMLTTAVFFFLGLLFLIGGVGAIFKSRAESYDRNSLLVNLAAGVVMIIIGIFLCLPIIRGLFELGRLLGY